MSRAALGHIACPTCGAQMRVNNDKNGDPFGHCEHCGQQLRVGGNSRRVGLFVGRYPWAAKGGDAVPVPTTTPPKPPAPPPVAAPAPAPKKRTASPFDFLMGAAP
jgi:hypothetical protein